MFESDNEQYKAAVRFARKQLQLLEQEKAKATEAAEILCSLVMPLIAHDQEGYSRLTANKQEQRESEIRGLDADIQYWNRMLEFLAPCPSCNAAPGKHPCVACGNTGRNQQAVPAGSPGEDRQLWAIKPNP